LECLFRQPRLSDLDDALCLRPVSIGKPCDANSICADDGVCVLP
jgi:hypothetical protein